MRIVITGVGLTCPGANSLSEFRKNLIENRAFLSTRELPGVGSVPAGLCRFDEGKHLSAKSRRRGTRAGSIAVYCAKEALQNANLEHYPKSRTGVYLGITEHGNIETEAEFERYVRLGRKISFWSHHQNPRIVSNAPAGEVTLALGLTGPHYTLGGACAAGNIGIIQGVQMLRLGEVDLALCGGVSEVPNGLSLFASFYAQGALSLNKDPNQACRPLDESRDGIVLSEGGAVFCLERLEDASKRKAPVLAEVVGYHINSDGRDFVLPSSRTQAECMRLALARANLSSVDLVNLHATGTMEGDRSECQAVRGVFPSHTIFNSTKGFIGHAMGAAGALELAGNLPGFGDDLVHGSKNTKNLDPEFDLPVVMDNRCLNKKTKTVMNVSFGMLGINSCIIVRGDL